MHESIIANMTIEEMEVYFSINDTDPYSKRLLELVKEINEKKLYLDGELAMGRDNLGEEIQSLEDRVAELEEEVEELEEKIEELTTDE